MRYTPQQMRSLVGIKPETERYWKRILGPISGYEGHTACYSLGDVLALKLIASLVQGLGISITRVEPLAIALFERCNSPLLEMRQALAMVFDITSGRVTMGATLIIPADSIGVIAINLTKAIDELRYQLLDAADSQLGFTFAPTGLSKVKAS